MTLCTMTVSSAHWGITDTEQYDSDADDQNDDIGTSISGDYLQSGHEDLLKGLGNLSKGDPRLNRVHVLWEELESQFELAGVAVTPGT